MVGMLVIVLKERKWAREKKQERKMIYGPWGLRGGNGVLVTSINSNMGGI